MAKNDKIVGLLKRLVEIESPSKQEDEIKKFVKDYLTNLGYKVVEGTNYVATKADSDLIVATHMDTVPVKKKFFHDGTYAYGTGVCDAKASVAAMLLAAENNLSYTLAFFCDEEEDGSGSKEFVRNWNLGKYAVVMEPTDLKIASKHWGSFELFVDVQGKPAHGAMSESGINAIEKALDIYNRLKGLGLNINPLKIRGGSDEYVIPHNCQIDFEVFIGPGEDGSDYLEKIKFLEELCNYQVDNYFTGYISKEVVHYLESAIKHAQLPVAYTEMKSWTDSLNLKERFDVVVWGPGSLDDCHTMREKVKIDDVKKAAHTLVHLSEEPIT